MCFVAPAYAKLGETVPQLLKRFGTTYTVESLQSGKKYKFRSENFSVDVIVENGVSMSETYLSDHPLNAAGEPPNDIVQAILRTNIPKAKWAEIEAAPFGANYALRSSDSKYIATLNYSGQKEEDGVLWTMTVQRAKSNRGQTVGSGSPSPQTSAPSINSWVDELKGKAEAGDADAQVELGRRYLNGEGVAKNRVEANKWYRKAAEQNNAFAQSMLGSAYYYGEGVAKNHAQAVKWYRKAAEQNDAGAQYDLGNCYYNGEGVPKDYAEAVKWFRKAAEQNIADAQSDLGLCYYYGHGVPKDYVEAYKWWLLAAGQGVERAKQNATVLENMMLREQIAEGQRLAHDFKPRKARSAEGDRSSTRIAQTRPESSGTGFFITDDGFLVTNEHVVKDAVQIRLVTSAGLVSARVIKVDSTNDLALLKAEGEFTALPVVVSRSMKLGGTVATVGFPNVGLQGFSPKFGRGEIGSLSGPQDDSRYFQISVPVQPGNSGGALVDERGNVVGVVSATLSARAALATSGALPQNVSYAVKSSFLLGFLESVPEVAAKLKEPNAKDMKFDDVVEQAKKAAVLVLCVLN